MSGATVTINMGAVVLKVRQRALPRSTTSVSRGEGNIQDGCRSAS